jgi:hypothetical protein
MKFSFGAKSRTKTKKTILFVCIENAGRSQIAEGFFRKYAPDEYEPVSPKFLSGNFRHDGCWMHLSIPPIPMKMTLGASILYNEIIL